MAIDKRLKIYDEQGNEVDYDILATDVKFLPDGKDLPTKLDELEQEIGEGGYTPPAGGIPKTDLAADVQTSLGKADTAVQDPNYVHTSNDYTTADKTKLAGLPTGSELNTTLGNKANDNIVVKSITVNGGQAQTPTNGNVNITVEGAAGEDGITPHIGSNGNWWIGPETDSNNDTGIHAQGPAGTSITDAELEIGNALNGEGDVLGMGGAMTIKRNVDSLYASLNRLYSKLANMAFWDATDQADAEPTALDWSVPKVTVTITNSIGAGAVIKQNGTVVSGSLQVDQGDELVLTVEALSEDYEISNLAVTVDGVAATLINGTLTIEHVNANTAIEFSGTATQVWFTVNYDDVYSGGSLVRYGIQQGRAIVRETSTTNKGWATSGIFDTNKPGTALFPAGEPVNTKIFTSNPDPVNQSPGTTEASYIPVPSGKQYMHVRIIDPQYVYGPSYSKRNDSSEEAALYDATKYRYNGLIAAYGNAVIGHTASGTATIPGFIHRGGYALPDDGNAADHKDGEVNYKFDLYAKATDAGASIGDVTYVKLLLCTFYNDQNSTQLATTDWLIMQASNGKQPVIIKYKFSND